MRDISINRTRVHLLMDQYTGRSMFRVIDAENHEVIREIPCEDIRRLSQRLNKLRGLIFDREA